MSILPNNTTENNLPPLRQPDKANNLDAGKDNTAVPTSKDKQAPQYTLLEPINNVGSVGISPTSFSDYIQSSFNVLFGVFIVWSVFRLAYGGVLFMTSDIINKKIDGKEMIINSIKYISLALITYSIMFFVNPDILDNKITNIIKGGVVTIGRGVGEAVRGTVVGGVGSGGVGGRECDDPALVIEKLKTGKNICSATTCSKTCKFTSDIIDIAKKEAKSAGIDYRIVLAISCRESTGNINAVGNHANNGYADCGLMQINMKGKGSNSCTSEIMNVENNIKEGIRLYKSKLSTARSYKSAENYTQALASYNCCSNGENPNDKSASCNSSNGFTDTIPKWACPIDPGTAAFNMCNVKNYACDVTACIENY